MKQNEDMVRIWAHLEGKAGPMFLSEADIMKAVQPHIVSTSEQAFALLRAEIPMIARECVKAYIAEQEADKRRIAAQLGYIVEDDGTIRPRVPTYRSFIVKHWVSFTLFLIVMTFIWPQIWMLIVRGLPWLRMSGVG
jgi:hypothetical protein